MKYFLCLLLFIVFRGYGQQPEGILFESATMKEIFAKAEKEKKIIFVDCYTTWCGPCQMMAKNVFTNKQVGDYFNRHFINIKMDMEKGDGPAMAKKYNVNVYPTFIFLNGKGELVYKFAGSRAPEDFIKSASAALDEQNVVRQSTVFKKRVQDTAFVTAYLNKLRDENLQEELEIAVKDYCQAISPASYLKPFNWNIILNHVSDYDSQAFRYVVDNYTQFVAFYGTQVVGNFFSNIYSSRIAAKFGFMCENFQQSTFDSLSNELRKIHMDFVPRRLVIMYAFRAMHLKKYDEFVRVVDDMYRYELTDQNDMDKILRLSSFINVLKNNNQVEYYGKGDEWLSSMIDRMENNSFAVKIFWEERIALAQKSGDTIRIRELEEQKDAFFKRKYEEIPIDQAFLKQQKEEMTPEEYEAFVKELKRLKVTIL